MSATTKIGLGVAAGYLLGRTKKLKLAITVGSMLAGQRIATDRRGLMQQGALLVDSNPELRKLRDQITGKMFEAAKAAAITTATSRLEGVTKQLQAGSLLTDEEDERDEDEYGEDEYDEEPEEEPEQEPQRRARKTASGAKKRTQGSARKATGTAKKTAARKTSSSSAAKRTTKKAASGSGTAKKTTARKTSAAKKTAKKAPAKKAAKKAPAKKSASRSGSRSRSTSRS